MKIKKVKKVNILNNKEKEDPTDIDIKGSKPNIPPHSHELLGQQCLPTL